ncbi:MAG: kelch repeat-containing protein [Burkholderiaceae bacterium]
MPSACRAANIVRTPDPAPAGPAPRPPLRTARSTSSAPARVGPIRAHGLLLLEGACRLLRRPLPSVRRDACLGGGLRFPQHEGSFSGILVPLVVLSAFVDLPVSSLLLHSMVAPPDRLALHLLIAASYVWTLLWALGLRSAARHVAHRLHAGELVLATSFGTTCRIPLAAIRDVRVLTPSERRALPRAGVARITPLDEANLLVALDPAHPPLRWMRAGRERLCPIGSRRTSIARRRCARRWRRRSRQRATRDTSQRRLTPLDRGCVNPRTVELAARGAADPHPVRTPRAMQPRRPTPTRFRASLPFALAALLAACGGGSSGGDTTPAPPATTWTATAGVAQKGPLAAGSTITVTELGLNLAPGATQHVFTTASGLGDFKPDAAFTSPNLSVVATGLYADEVAGGTSDGPVTLQSHADLATQTVLGVNLLTTLAYARIDRLVQGGAAIAAARAQAEREVLAALGIRTDAGLGDFATLDLSGTTDGDHALAALSAAFVQGRASADVAALIADVQADIAANGTITRPSTRAALAASAQALDLDKVAARLDALYAASAVHVDAVALAAWIDQDGDGVIARDEFRVDDAAATPAFTLPADFAAAHAGASVSASAGTLAINGAPAAAGATLHAGDVVTLSAPAALGDGVLRAYIDDGATPIARVAFVKGLVGIDVTPGSGALPVGLSQPLVATGHFADGSTADLTRDATWASAAPAVATVGAATGVADALAVGRTTVSASIGGVAGARALDTVAATVQSIVLSPSALQTGVGITRRLVATGTFSDGSVADISASASWSAATPSIATVAQGAVTGAAPGSTGITATLDGVSASTTVAVATDAWTPLPAMPHERVAGHSVTALADGRVLLAGGVDSGGAGLAAVDVFDPATQAWQHAAPMATARSSHAATLLGDGRVLVTGGSLPGGAAAQGYANLASAEIYDPAANTWTTVAPMAVARSHHTATLLADGRVLVVGGENAQYLVEASAELFDPATGRWTSTPLPPDAARSQHTATLLADGRVLLAGGFDIEGGTGTSLATAEAYDPAAGGFLPVAAMATTHSGHSATRLTDGRVLVAGGGNAQAELFDPVAGTWTPAAALAAVHTGHAAVRLADGGVLVVAGTQGAQPAAERYDPAANAWTPTAPMQVLRAHAGATLLPDGSVLACGGAPDSAGIDCEAWW